MKMVRKIAFANMKYHKSKNILTGIAIFLTTLLLYMVPTVGMALINGQFAMINELYPMWHGRYRELDSQIVEKLEVHHDIARYGLRSDVGKIKDTKAEVMLFYMDKECMDLCKIHLAEGRFPEKSEEIVVTKGILKEIGQQGNIGDTIRIPCQIYRNGGLDFAEEKQFVISGFLEDAEMEDENRTYSALVSKAFFENEIPKEQRVYRFFFQVKGTEKNILTDEIEERIENIALQFGIEEKQIKINNEYLAANYIDAAFVSIITGIMLIIVFAGIITIYSIYYVSMGERIQEFGKIKAIGATKQQIRQIVLWEGLAVAMIAVPITIIVGTVLAKSVFLGILKLYNDESFMVSTIDVLFEKNQVQIYYWWIYLLAIVVTFITVYISLHKPMRIMAKVSEMEAIRYQMGESGGRKKSKKGYRDITVGRLAKIYLSGNKKKSFMTITSMSATGIFLMVVATVLACATPEESANASLVGQYEISIADETGNKEHPEREWSNIQQYNPLTKELEDRIEQINGIKTVSAFSEMYVSLVDYENIREGILGIPEEYKDTLMDGIIEGEVTYEELCRGDKVIADQNLFRWYPDIALGDKLKLIVQDDDTSYEKTVEIAAIGDYPIGFTNFSFLLMAKDGVETFSEHNLHFYYHVLAEENYNEKVKMQLEEIIAETEFLQMRTWQQSYEEHKAALALTCGACYAFLGILGVICIMNMMNTMIHNVHVRKKEIGMLQAIGMSDTQLLYMLQIEGVFYTVGTLILSVGGGSILGHPVYQWAKQNGILNIRNYHYPVNAAIIVSVILFLVQIVLAVVIAKSVKKESLIDRVRFSE
ncbi:MAG: ABC transporter permease [Lachnospiraceae bacterium]|nr:ABC transporter permease [Lachnospiraceae bacterium]